MRNVRRWSIPVLVGAALVVVALGGCGGTPAPAPSPEGDATLPAVATQEMLPISTEEAPSVSPGQAPETPILVHLSMDKAPKLNEEAEVVMEIEAIEDAPGTTAEFILPPEAQVVSGDVRWEGEVKAGSPVRLTITILFTAEGEYGVGGKALRPVNPDMVWGDEEYVYLTVGEDSASFGIEPGGESLTTGSGPPGEEPATPLRVHMDISKPPMVNEEVDLVLEIEAIEDAPGTTAEFILPPEAQVVSGDVRWEGEVKAGTMVRLPIRILFTAEGEYAVGGKALRPVTPDMVWGDEEYVYLTVKQDSGSFGFESGDETPPLTASPVP